MFFRGETSDQYLFNVILKPFYLWTELFSGDSLVFTGEGGSLQETLYKGYKLPLFCISKAF